MKRYYYTAQVARQVLDTINICVEASSQDEAVETVEAAIKVFPEALDHDRIKHMYVDNRDQITADLVDLERKIPTNDG